MKINFTEIAWNDYLYWQGQDKKTIKRINQLIQDIDRNHNEGTGKPT
ncbi:MAG: type II toxin-antitoxin system YoeB family toxin [Dysgonamonadaceae bacterium]|nr:type II toxin-antitoxin system YoeB family toxin [Dysgonamonadaceae bacterium]